MAPSANKMSFGIHSICAYNPDTLEPYGIAKVIGSLSLNLSGEQIPLNGGSNPYPWAVEKGIISAEGTLLIKESPSWAMNAFLGSTPVENGAEASGAVGTLTNAKGTSVVAATGIASVGLKSGQSANVKTGLYVVKAASATTVNVYAMTDVDFLRGTDLTYQDDLLKINASALTITTGGAVEIPNLGLELTGGAGTIGMTAGDTAWFDARAINTSNRVTTIGTSGQSIPDLGIFCAAQKRGSFEMFFLDMFRVAASGFPFNFTEKTWNEGEVSFQCFYDSVRNGIMREIYVKGTA